MKLVEFAHAAGRAFTARLTRAEQRELGQFMTPPTIARFMASRLVAGFLRDDVRVLEPAAGAGILAAAVVEELLTLPQPPKKIELFLFECDQRLLPVLAQFVAAARSACADVGVEFDCLVKHGDFLVSELALSTEPIEGLLVISNPPFLKLNKTSDVRATLHSYAVFGQPNIYGLFMAACARLTAPSSRWCFITPRSWMNGAYFGAVRHTLLAHLSVEGLHAFESRSEGFEEDAVLQETVITWASGRRALDQGASIMLTRSQGASDLGASEVAVLPAERIVSTETHAMVRLPHEHEDVLARWDATLKTYGWEVSTGPVVAFRAARFIESAPVEGAVPLLWLQHVGQQTVCWPIQKKREFIRASAENAWMLVRNQPMVVMRRFSPKEDKRRVTCAAYEGSLPGSVVGLENHLNYIYKRGGSMSAFEARGLSAFLASDVVDSHFRGLAGSTQVNATELRLLQLPPLALIVEIGKKIGLSPPLSRVDTVVREVLGVTPIHRAVA